MEDLQLSSNALLALQEFMAEEQERKATFAQLEAAAEQKFELVKKDAGHGAQLCDMSLFKEDWQLSQFWYSDATAEALADELLDGADSSTRIAIVSAPSLYAALKKRESLPTEHIYLLEYDERFRVLAGDHFVHYDFNSPTAIPPELEGIFDRVAVDPPFLNEETQTKEAVTANWLLKDDRSAPVRNKVIICTGERMKDVVLKSYKNVVVTEFEPQHGNGLSNEFLCYATPGCERLRAAAAAQRG